MDILTLITFLTPALPYLAKLGDKAAETAAEKLGEATWTKATAIWQKLHPKVEAKPAAQEAIADLIQSPEDPDRQAALRVQLKKILEQDDELCRAIAQILASNDPVPTTAINQTVTGNSNQVIGQAYGSTVFNVSGGSVTFGGPQNNPTPSAPEPPAPVKTILVLAANPKGSDPLRLGEEVSAIQKGLERAKDRDRFKIEQRWAVTTKDVQRALLDCQPQFVHFAGHGVGVESTDDSIEFARDIGVDDDDAPEGLIFEDVTGQPHLVPTEAIANLFSLFANQIECIVLNACYSATQADAIAQHIPFVVGMKRKIGDRAAIEFAIGFYDALLAGRDVDFAFKLGCSAIELEGIPEQLTPTLKHQSK
jgi:hypothetical protein